MSHSHEQFDDPDFWARIVANNARAIARLLVETGCVTLTRDWMLENGELIYAIDIHDGLSS